jgi:methylglyoxal reductase
MKLRKLGKSGIETSLLCLGTWAIGGGPWWGKTNDDESVKAIRASIDAGITFIDTAPAYGFGRSEEVVGRAVKGIRDKVVISTKCGLWWHGEEGTPFFEMDGYDVRRCLRPETIRRELDYSLQRLGTDYIDLYITHWQEEGAAATPIAETMECLLELKAEGKIKAIGASNTTTDQIREYVSAGPLDTIQERYTMLDRHLEPSYIDLCTQKNICVMGYSTIEQGLLTGKIGMDTVFGDSEFRNQNSWFMAENRKRVLDMLAGWDDLTKKYSSTLSQLVIAWTAAQPGLTFPLIGARKPAHAVENAEAGSLELESADILRMRNDVEGLGEPK